MIENRAGKANWRLKRQFQKPQDLQREFGWCPDFRWRVRKVSGTLEQRAVKLLLEDDQGRAVETVTLFPGAASAGRSRRATACISSQPGCGVGCPFCATGRLGFRGQLSTAEIVEQVYWAGTIAADVGRRLRNVVFMGMGEPLHNEQNVLAAIDELTSESGFGLSARRITVSTAGVPGAMQRLVTRFPRVRLALSLHSAAPEVRRKLVPRGVQNLDLLRETIVKINCLQPDSPLWLEWIMLEGLNDSEADAQQLLKFCSGLRVEVNLIPYNPAVSDERFAPSSQTRREAFAHVLRSGGVRTTIRTSFGSESAAACGQLRAARPHT